MTIERRLVVGLADIVAFCFECKACHAKVTVAPDKVEMNRLLRCPMCNESWFKGEKPGGMRATSLSPFSDFVEALAQMKTLESQAGFTVALLFEEPPR